MNNETVIINMLKTDMGSIHDVPIPSGYSLRRYKEGDRQVWVKLYDKLDDYIDITVQLFDKFFGYDQAALSEGMFFCVTMARK